MNVNNNTATTKELSQWILNQFYNIKHEKELTIFIFDNGETYKQLQDKVKSLCLEKENLKQNE